MTDKEYKICNRCVMDTSDPDIQFNKEGTCIHCLEMEKVLKYYSSINKNKELKKNLSEIEKAGKNNKYNCLIGVSGGVDSSYVAYLVKKYGLRPLAVHLDNGWNTELAVKNIENILKNLNIDLYTYVIDWQEFKDIQLSFLKSSTPDSEIPTDHAINAILYKVAAKEKIKYIIYGTNTVTENILPKSWSQGHYDWSYIRCVQKRFGSKKIKTFPHFTFLNLVYFKRLRGIKTFSILDYIDYNKDDAKDYLVTKLGWRDYGGKHHESIYTKFFQTYILPVKFGFDKRRAHLSSLIVAGHISREQALLKLNQGSFEEHKIKNDIEYVAKKFDLTIEAFESILSNHPKKYLDYRKYPKINSYYMENLIFSKIISGMNVKKIVNKIKKYY